MAALSYVYRRRVRSQARVRRAQEGEIASVAVGGAVRDGGRQGVRLRGLRERARARGQRAAAGRRRRGGAAAGALRRARRRRCARSAPRSCSSSARVRVSHGAISPGELLVFASYTRKAQSPMRSFAREMTKVAAAMAKADRIAELLAADDVLARAARRLPRRRAPPATSRSRTCRSATAPARPVLAGVSLRDAAGRARRADGAVGRRQVDARRARRALLRPDRGARADRRARRARLLAGVAARAGRGRAPGHRAVQRHRARQHRLRDRRDARARSWRPRARRRRDEFIRALPEGYDTDLGPAGRRRSRAASGSGSASRARCCATRRCSCSTSRRPGSTPPARRRCSTASQALMRGRTTILITHSRAAGARPPTASSSSRAGGSPRRAPRATAELPLERLLDPDEMRALLARALGGEDRLGDVEIGRVVYKPGDTRRRPLPRRGRRRAARRRRDADRRRRPRASAIGAPRLRRARAQGAGRARSAPAAVRRGARRARHVAAVRPEAAGAGRGARRARAAARDPRSRAEPALVGYKPRARAVLRANGHVLKAYGAPRQFEAALAGLRAADRAGRCGPARSPAPCRSCG